MKQFLTIISRSFTVDTLCDQSRSKRERKMLDQEKSSDVLIPDKSPSSRNFHLTRLDFELLPNELNSAQHRAFNERALNEHGFTSHAPSFLPPLCTFHE